MAIGKPTLGIPFRLMKAAAAKAWPKLRILLIVAIAISMAEFVAIDFGLVLAADIMLYVEIMIGAWAIALTARFMPGLSTALMMLPGRVFDFGSPAHPSEDADELN